MDSGKKQKHIHFMEIKLVNYEPEYYDKKPLQSKVVNCLEIASLRISSKS